MTGVQTCALPISTRPFFIGRNEGGTNIFTGYMDNIRICCGQSAYTPNFVPYGGQKNVAANRGGVVTDARHPSANTHAIRMGQAAMGSTLATNANTYCLDFDGTADYLINKTPNWNSSDDRGTIFAWVYHDDSGDGGLIFTAHDTGSSNKYLRFQKRSDGEIGRAHV